LVAALIATFIPPDYLAGRTWAQGLGGMLLVLAISIPLYSLHHRLGADRRFSHRGGHSGGYGPGLSDGRTSYQRGDALGRLSGAGDPRPGDLSGDRDPDEHPAGTRLRFLTARYSCGGTVPADGHGGHSPSYLAIGSALLLSGLLAYLLGLRLKAMIRGWRDPAPGTDLMLKVDGMSCGHCVSSVKKSLEGVVAVSEATPDLASRLVWVRGEHLGVTDLVRAVEQAGFRALQNDG